MYDWTNRAPTAMEQPGAAARTSTSLATAPPSTTVAGEQMGDVSAEVSILSPSCEAKLPSAVTTATVVPPDDVTGARVDPRIAAPSNFVRNAVAASRNQ